MTAKKRTQFLKVIPDMESQIDELFEKQLDEWPMFDDNYNLLGNAIENNIEISDTEAKEPFWAMFKMLLQYRKGSLSAKIDSESIASRACFLCAENRPFQQRAIDWNGYEILVNPYPVADSHLTIAVKEHIPQRIAGHIRDMAKLARILPGHCVFYNGPRCGASAPDHMHFQALDQCFSVNVWMPPEQLKTIRKYKSATLYRPHTNNRLFPYFIIESEKDNDLEVMFNRILLALPPSEPEPMMNIVMFRNDSRIRTLIVPRRAHRPSCYGSDGGRMLVSPASVEMLGTFITSRTEDFERLTRDKIIEIYHEVCLNDEQFDEILDRIPT